MSSHVFERGEDVLWTDQRIGTLKSAYCRHSHARREIGILAVRLLEASPPWLPCDIDDRCEHLTYTAGARFGRCGREDTLHQVGVPATRERNGLRKARRPGRFETMQRFLVEEHRNAEPRAVTNPSLDGVDEFGFAPCIVVILWPFDSANANPEPPRRGGGIKTTAGVGNELLLTPQAEHLRDLLVERHTREEVTDAALDREPGIAIRQSGTSAPPRLVAVYLSPGRSRKET